MKKKISKIVTIILMILIIIVTILISVYVSKDIFYKKNTKSKEDFIGTFSWGATEKNNEKMIYLAIINDDENENSIQFIEYYVSNEEIIKKGECILTNDNYVVLLDENGNYFASIVYVIDGYLLFDNEKKAKSIEKIVDGPVLPTK